MTVKAHNMARPASLSLAMPMSMSTVSSTMTSPTDDRSESPSPPKRVKAINDGDVVPSNTKRTSNDDQPNSPDFTSLPPFPSSPVDMPRLVRESSRGFFSNLKASKSSNKVNHVEPTIRQVSEDLPRSNAGMGDTTIYSMRKNPGSTPDLSLSDSVENVVSEDRGGESFKKPDFIESAKLAKDQQVQKHRVPRRPVGSSVASDSVIAIAPDEASNAKPKKPKPRLGGLLTRTRSMRMDETGRFSKPSTPIRPAGPEIRLQYDEMSDNDGAQAPPKTAPIRQDKSYRDMMSSTARNRSADRQSPSNRSQENMSLRRGDKTSTQGLSASSSGGSRESGGSHLFTNLKNTSNKAAGGLGKAGKNIFGKVSRSGSSNAKEEERYTLKVINLPLIQQTRRTRMASRLAESRDKTEFWMPALPWRCIE